MMGLMDRLSIIFHTGIDLDGKYFVFQMSIIWMCKGISCIILMIRLN